MSKVFDFNKADIMQTLSNTGRSLDTFNGFLHRPDDLRHSYEKFRFTGDVNKPPFDEVYHSVKAYIKDVLPREKKGSLKDSNKIAVKSRWDYSHRLFCAQNHKKKVCI